MPSALKKMSVAREEGGGHQRYLYVYDHVASATEEDVELELEQLTTNSNSDLENQSEPAVEVDAEGRRWVRDSFSFCSMMKRKTVTESDIITSKGY